MANCRTLYNNVCSLSEANPYADKNKSEFIRKNDWEIPKFVEYKIDDSIDLFPANLHIQICRLQILVGVRNLFRFVFGADKDWPEGVCAGIIIEKR